jgi:hypothetical protein
MHARMTCARIGAGIFVFGFGEHVVSPRWDCKHCYKIFTTAGLKPLTTAGLGPSVVKVVADKNGHHRWEPGAMAKLKQIRDIYRDLCYTWCIYGEILKKEHYFLKKLGGAFTPTSYRLASLLTSGDDRLSSQVRVTGRRWLGFQEILNLVKKLNKLFNLEMVPPDNHFHCWFVTQTGDKNGSTATTTCW